jgi:hypothetical protein
MEHFAVQRFSRFTTSDAANRHHHGRDRHTVTSTNACHTGTTSASTLVAGTAGGSGAAAEATGGSYDVVRTISVLSVVGGFGGLEGVYGRRELNIQGGGR